MDLRYATRMLRKQPAFTVAAVLALALGIGATTAIFSVVYSVLIKPLPYPNADELVRIRHRDVGGERYFSETMYLTYREENRTFASIGLWDETSATLTDRGEPQQVRALRVTDGTLQALGVPPMRGRWFTTQEYGPAAEGLEPVILSYGFWQRRFGGDDAALGRELSMEAPSGSRARPRAGQWQVVGIMPRGFRFLDMGPQPDVIVAMRLDPAARDDQLLQLRRAGAARAGCHGCRGERRRRAHVADLARRMANRARGLTKDSDCELANHSGRSSFEGRPGRRRGRHVVGGDGCDWRRAADRVCQHRESDARAGGRAAAGVRRARGARRGAGAYRARVVRREPGAGRRRMRARLGLAYAGVQVLVAIGPTDLPRLQDIAVYPPVLAFTVAIALASTVLFGSITALKHALHIETPTIGTARGSSASRDRSTARSALVVVQVALALVLIVSAALMIRTFQALRGVDAGFSNPATIQTVGISIPFRLVSDPEPGAPVARKTSLQQEILDRIAALPGVASVGFASHLPMGRGSWNAPVVVEGETIASGRGPRSRRWNFVSPGYFAAMGTRMIAGRDVTWSDIEAGGRVAVISEDFARELAASPAAALGRRIRLRVDAAGSPLICPHGAR